MRKINLIPLFIACILSACLSPSEGDGSPDEPPTVTPTSSPTTVFTATPSQTPTPEPKPTPDPEQIAAEDLADFKLNPADFTQKIGENGEIQYWDGSTLIYSGGAWNANEIGRILADAAIKDPNFCKPTEFLVDKESGIRNMPENHMDVLRYGYWLLDVTSRTDAFKAIEGNELPLSSDGAPTGLNYHIKFEPLNGTENCWAFFTSPKSAPLGAVNFITWETKAGQPLGVPVFQP